MGMLFDPIYLIQSIPKLLEYVGITLLVTGVTVVLGMIVGIVVAFVCSRRIRGLYLISKVYISYVRGTPLIVQLFLCFFSLPAFLQQMGISDARNIPVIAYAYIVCSLHLGGYMAEVLRGALVSVGASQLEASYAMGMSTLQCYRRILFPQALVLSLPDISNQVVATLKNTALLFNIGLVDMMTRAKLLGGFSQRYLELYLATGLIYILLCIAFDQIFRYLEQTMRVAKYGY